MSSFRFWSTSITFLFFGLSAYGQDFRPGFIVKQNGDSVPGYIQNKSAKLNSQGCTFKLARNSKEISKYAPGDLKRYGIIDYRYYESREVTIAKKDEKKKTLLFLEILTNGSAKLFRDASHFYLEKDSLLELPKDSRELVKTADDRVYYKPTGKLRSFLNSNLKDCYVRVDKTKSNERDLTELIQNYNKCKGKMLPVGKTKLPWKRVNVGLFSGVDNSSITVNGADVQEKNSSFIGGSLLFTSPRANDKFSITVEAWYLKKQYFVNYTQYFQQLNLDASYLKIPVGARFNFSQPSRTPFIEMGLSYYAQLSISGLVYDNLYPFKVVSNNTTVGAWAGLGYNQRIFKHVSAFISLRVEKNSSFFKSTINSNTSASVTNFLAGLRF